MRKSTRRIRAAATPNTPSTPTGKKAAKPRFPLWLHRASNQWCCKRRGKFYYFGNADEVSADEALKRYNAEMPDLLAGRTVPKTQALIQLRDVCNQFLNAKLRALENGELAELTFRDYKVVCGRMVACFGATTPVAQLGAEQFAQLRQLMSKTLGPVALGHQIARTRSVFKHAVESGLLDRAPVYGAEFKGPTRAILRRQVNEAELNGNAKVFAPEEIRTLLEHAGTHLRAMILLGINGGFGNADCGSLPLAALDLEVGWVNFPRPKTGIQRRAKLWPETVEALRESLAKRPQPKYEEAEGLVFVTVRGGSWAKQMDGPLAKEFAKLLTTTGLKKPGRGFYSLRHSFRVVADETADAAACDVVMGHESSHISERYRSHTDSGRCRGVSNERLQAVADVVHGWLFG